MPSIELDWVAQTLITLLLGGITFYLSGIRKTLGVLGTELKAAVVQINTNKTDISWLKGENRPEGT